MTEEEVRERLRFLSAAQHEANTPLAVIRGWADTFASMWDDLAMADRERGTASIQRFSGVLTELLDALFVELRADAHARAPRGATAELARAVNGVAGQADEATVPGGIPPLTVAMNADALEALLSAILVGLRRRLGGPVTVAVQEGAGEAIVTVTAVDPTSGAGAPGSDPFDPFPGDDPSPAGIRLYAARRLADAFGARLSVEDGQARLALPLA